MRFKVETARLVGIEDRLEELEGALDLVEYQMDAPEWYWFESEWNRYRTTYYGLQQKIKVARARLERGRNDAYLTR
jgi:hypothetical protein